MAVRLMQHCLDCEQPADGDRDTRRSERPIYFLLLQCSADARTHTLQFCQLLHKARCYAASRHSFKLCQREHSDMCVTRPLYVALVATLAEKSSRPESETLSHETTFSSHFASSIDARRHLGVCYATLAESAERLE